MNFQNNNDLHEREMYGDNNHRMFNDMLRDRNIRNVRAHNNRHDYDSSNGSYGSNNYSYSGDEDSNDVPDDLSENSFYDDDGDI